MTIRNLEFLLKPRWIALDGNGKVQMPVVPGRAPLNSTALQILRQMQN
jgi:hypothetical protein